MAKAISELDKRYLKYAIEHDLPSLLKWFNFMFATVMGDAYEDEYILIVDGVFYVKQDGDEVILRKKYDGPVWDTNDTLTIEPGFLPMVTKNIERVALL